MAKAEGIETGERRHVRPFGSSSRGVLNIRMLGGVQQGPKAVRIPLDPAEYGIDPLTYL